MKTRILYGAGAIAVLIALGLSAGMLAKAGYACANPSKFAAMKIGDANGCFEFWFNRYQSLIGNVLTAAVAGITLLWIARQLEVSHRESAISAASALRIRVDELVEECGFLGEFFDEVMLLQSAIKEPESESQIDEAIDCIIFRMRASEPFFDRGYADGNSELRMAVVDRWHDVIFARDTSADAFGPSAAELLSAVLKLQQQLAGELRDTWATIRDLEKRATAVR